MEVICIMKLQNLICSGRRKGRVRLCKESCDVASFVWRKIKQKWFPFLHDERVFYVEVMTGKVETMKVMDYVEKVAAMVVVWI